VKTMDGTGAPLVDSALYYVQDARPSSTVGNCGSWWAPNGNGYVCSIDEAGKYTGERVKSMRDTDVPWPVEYVETRTVRHCRVDNQAFERRDDAQPKPRARQRRHA
jgi:hypothetical protein